MKYLRQKSILLSVLVGVFTISTLVFSATWQNPAGPPPTDNVAAPLNQGGTHQVKEGNLGIERLSGDNAEFTIQSTSGAGEHWAVYHDRGTDDLRLWNDDNRFTFTEDGKLGIGTDDPREALDLAGGDIIGVNKITVDVIDPEYELHGNTYSTYAPSMLGLKEEIVGIASTAFDGENYSYTIDFDSESEGTDLWVWREVVDFSPDNVVVTVTPRNRFAGSYYTVGENSITIVTDTATELSYRLTAARHDHADWPTKQD